MNYKKLTVFGLALAVLAVSGCTSSTVAPATSWAEGACSKEQPGVTLSIDYLGAVTTHCALAYSGNGWNLFQAAGFEVQGTAKYPTAFACKIDGNPKATKCDDTESSGAYWGYYLASNGKWDYATTGASDHNSSCGTHEGWVYMQTEKTELHLPAPAEFICN